MIDDKTARMAVNTLIAYSRTKIGCSGCTLSGSCSPMHCCFRSLSGYDEVETFNGMPPKFDVTQKNSADFRQYINEIFMREAEKYGLPMSTANSIKWSANGEIKVTFVDDDNKTNYMGRAKCHPSDAFNPEVGIKLAIERAAQAMHAPFVPTDGETYYYVDDEDTIYSTLNNNNNKDTLNIAVGNCFRKRKEALANKEAIMKRIERATELLKKLRDERDE